MESSVQNPGLELNAGSGIPSYGNSLGRFKVQPTSAWLCQLATAGVVQQASVSFVERDADCVAHPVATNAVMPASKKTAAMRFIVICESNLIQSAEAATGFFTDAAFRFLSALRRPLVARGTAVNDSKAVISHIQHPSEPTL
jgi:hypothetical protein